MFGSITGSGFYDIPDLDERSMSDVETPFGRASVTSRSMGATITLT
jgi:purine nucleoside phosphorylase